MITVAVVPAFREEQLISDTVHALTRIDGIDRIVVVDDASGDLTSRNASAAGATVVSNGRNHGKGTSLNRVLPHLDFDVLLLVDGDLGTHAGEAEILISAVTGGEADIAIASFGPASRKGGFGLAKGLGRAGIRLLTGAETRTPLSGQRAMTREAYKKVAPFAAGFGMEVAMTVDALRAGLRVVELDTTMSHRETGRDVASFLHRGRQFRDILYALARRFAGS
jgi:glycosyltransferase involved in cell wall biosynthesis